MTTQPHVLLAPELLEWAKRCTTRVGQRVNPVSTQRQRKMLVVHLDGVPRALLDEAISSGRMPFLRSLVQSGAYSLDSAFWGSPASTPCFQAGLLYGIRHPNLPAYHWFDRELGRVVRMNIPEDARNIEDRLGRQEHHSLLEDGGTAYLSLFNAFATDRLCMSSLADLKRLGRTLPALMKGIRAPARSGVSQYVQKLVRQSWATGLDVFSWASHLRNAKHEGDFLVNQLGITLAWDFAHKRALIDMVRGVPAIYLVFGNYDEVAHRRGPRSPQAEKHLHRVDHRLAELYAVARTQPVPYDVYFVTDHGHVESHPFEQRSGRKVKTLLFEGPPGVLQPALEAALLDGRPLDSVHATETEEGVAPEFVDAGNFAHVYLSRRKEPLDVRELLANHHSVFARAVNEREVGIVVVRRGAGAVAIVGGKMLRPEDVTEARIPRGFSARALEDFLRELPHMKTAGDIVLFGQYVDDAGTVGFAWEFGSHGGLTKIETNSMVMWPRNAPLDLSGLTHATQLHERLSAVYRN